MLKPRRTAWLSIGIVVLTLLLNVLIIKIAFVENQNLFWLLIVSILLLAITIYHAWQKDHLLQNYFTGRIQPSTAWSQFKWFHSIYQNKIAPIDLKVQIGNDQCSQPYSACIFNVVAIEDTNLESTFVQPRQEKNVEHSENSVSEGLNTYHLAAGGLVWQIGSDYRGCRTENGHFNSKAFKKTACSQEVKMIELKLSSARKPLCAEDSFLDFAEPIRGKIVNTIFSDSAFSTFRDAEGMIHFLNNLRELSGGKPIGIRLCINDKKEFYQICYSVRKAQLIPDFIIIEGSFESTGKVHSHQAFHTGIPLHEALLFVSQTLQMYGLQNKIKVIADGKIISCFDILKVLALGADLVCTEMPRNTPIKYAAGGRELSHHYKFQNVCDFHDTIMIDTIQLMSVCGFRSVSDITLAKFLNRLEVLHSIKFAELISHALYPASKKIYNSKVKPYRPRKERNKIGIP
jgi:hypothetical protein